MSKIITPFKPTLTITIDVNEKTGEANMSASKPVAPGILFDIVHQMVRRTFIETVNEYEKRMHVPPPGASNGH